MMSPVPVKVFVASLVILVALMKANTSYCGVCQACVDCGDYGRCVLGPALGDGPLQNCHMCRWCAACHLCTILSVVARSAISVLLSSLYLSIVWRYGLVKSTAAAFLIALSCYLVWYTVGQPPAPLNKSLWVPQQSPEAEDTLCDSLPESCVILQVYRYGRTGNNLIQLFNALEAVYRCGGLVETVHMDPMIPARVNPYGLPLGEAERRCTRHLLRASIFSGPFDTSGCRCRPAHSWRPVYLEELIGGGRTATVLREETLVVHIRGGDTFMQLQHPVTDHDQPPCSFYAAAISAHNSTDVLLVVEDDLGPCPRVLRAQFPLCRVATLSAQEALSVLVRARHLVCGHTSFCFIAAFASLQHHSLYLTSHGRHLDYLNGAHSPLLNRHFLAAPPERLCTINYDRQGLLPWVADGAQLELIRGLPSGPLRCAHSSDAEQLKRLVLGG